MLGSTYVNLIKNMGEVLGGFKKKVDEEREQETNKIKKVY